MSTARNKQSIPVYEDGNIVRDFVYIDDVAEVIVSIALNGPDSDIAYDIGSGHPISLYTLASKIANFYGAPRHMSRGNTGTGTYGMLVATCRRLYPD